MSFELFTLCAILFLVVRKEMTQNNSTGVSLGMGKDWYDKFALAILQCLYSLVYFIFYGCLVSRIIKAGLSIQYTVALFSHLVSDMVSSTVYVSLVNVL